MALANIAEIERRDLVEASARKGRQLVDLLRSLESKQFHLEVRGLGLMAGIELSERNGHPATAATIQIITRLLHRGFIFLPEGEHANVISFTPPLTISSANLRESTDALGRALAEQPLQPG